MDLRPYQRDGVDFLRGAFSDEHARVRLLFDEMGLGKTPQAVMALPGAVWDEPQPGVAIVCPAGLRTVWARHLRDWRPDLAPVIVRSTAEIRPPRVGEAVIMSYDALAWAAGAGDSTAQEVAASEALARFRSGMLSYGPDGVWILDEAHKIKGSKSARAVTLGSMLRPCVARGSAVYVLTATPMPRDALDAWTLAVRVGIDSHPRAWGGRQQAGWQSWARASLRGRTWSCAATPTCPIDHPSALGSLAKRRLVADHLPEIPPPVHEIRLIGLSSEIVSLADEILRAACGSVGVDVRRVSRESVDGPDEIDERIFREIGSRRGELAKMESLVAAAKVPAVMEEVRRCVDGGEPVLVYSEHRAPIDALAAAGYPTITGDTSQRKRTAAADAFQDGESTVLGFTAAGREGLTLTRAATFIEADTNWSVDDRDQALGRAQRFGRDTSVRVVHVLADHPAERLKARVLHRKRVFKVEALGTSL